MGRGWLSSELVRYLGGSSQGAWLLTRWFGYHRISGNVDVGTRPRSVDKTELSCEPMFGERCETELSLLRVPVAKEETKRRARPIHSEKTSVVQEGRQDVGAVGCECGGMSGEDGCIDWLLDV